MGATLALWSREGRSDCKNTMVLFSRSSEGHPGGQGHHTVRQLQSKSIRLQMAVMAGQIGPEIIGSLQREAKQRIWEGLNVTEAWKIRQYHTE